MKRIATLTFSLALVASSAGAVTELANSRTPYQDCTGAIAKNPQDAFEAAMTWRDHGGGIQSEHCVALALLALNEAEEAARRFDALARRADAGTLMERAAFLSQSGNAWLAAQKGPEAEAAFSAALKLTPRDADAWIDRGRAKAMRRNWAGAETDLNSALTFNPRSAEARTLRAAARDALGRKAEAKADIDAALRLDPNYADALVERGAMRLAAGDKKGAREDWARVLRVAPQSAAGDLARTRIEKLELGY